MRAIDVHVHVPRQPGLEEFGIEEGLRAMFRMREDPPDPDGMAKIYRDLDVSGGHLLGGLPDGYRRRARHE